MSYITSVFAFILLTISPPTLSTRDLLGLPDHYNRESSIQELKRNLVSYDQREVYLRGFLYQTAGKQWVLAAEPDLKSCCIGATDKVAQQVFLEGDFAQHPSSRAMLLQGTFHVEPRWNEMGMLVQLYRMENARVVPHSQWPITVLALCALLVGGGTFLWILVRRQLRS